MRKDIMFSIIMQTYNRAFCIEKSIDAKNHSSSGSIHEFFEEYVIIKLRC